ncbi:alpha/beta fold hydrolase [Conyzicola sp.]|uniref:alpha/beta fold hydrolase n=1 Tax=Conyzicola sp. TaxID=1969404 RepID=UPI003988CEAB
MPELPTTTWGDPQADRRALLVHGLTSSGATWWRVGESLADAGWHVTAVDLRGNGDAPAADGYAFADYASDLPRTGWNVVVGHSLGGAVATLAALRPGFAERLVLLDPALVLPTAELDGLLAGELGELELDEAGFRELRPTWHPLDVSHKATATAKATADMVERTIAHNTPWTALHEAKLLAVPTLIVGGDHAVYSMLPTTTAEALTAANPIIDYRVIQGSGHSPHRDRPDETLALLREWLG